MEAGKLEFYLGPSDETFEILSGQHIYIDSGPFQPTYALINTADRVDISARAVVFGQISSQRF